MLDVKILQVKDLFYVLEVKRSNIPCGQNVHGLGLLTPNPNWEHFCAY